MLIPTRAMTTEDVWHVINFSPFSTQFATSSQIHGTHIMNISNGKLKAVTTYATPESLFPALPITKILTLEPLETVNKIWVINSTAPGMAFAP